MRHYYFRFFAFSAAKMPYAATPPDFAFAIFDAAAAFDYFFFAAMPPIRCRHHRRGDERKRASSQEARVRRERADYGDYAAIRRC
jgi:hypothetical protein